MTTREREPLRLLSDASTDPLMQGLLQSACADNPSPLALRDAPTAIAEQLAGPARSPLLVRRDARRDRRRLLRIVRWVGASALFGTSLAAAVIGVRTATPSVPGGAATSANVAPAPSALGRTRRATKTMPATEPLAPEVSAMPSADLPPQRAAAPKKPPANELSQEVAYLDSAKAALSAANPTGALAALEQADRLQRRALWPEATVLRVRALNAAGRKVEARAIAERYIQAAPNSPQAEVLRSMLKPSEKSDPNSKP